MKNEASFSKRLGTALRRNQPSRDSAIGTTIGLGDNAGLRLGMDFVFSILIGSGIGYGLDRLFGTVPIFVIVFFIMGFCAGLLNILRAGSQSASDKS